MIVHGAWLKISEQNDIRGFKPKSHSNFKRLLNTTASYLCNFLGEIYSPNFVRFDLKNISRNTITSARFQCSVARTPQIEC